MASYLYRQLDQLIAPADNDMGSQVRRVVSSLLSAGCCSSVNVARKLGLSPATFFRKMAQLDIRYADILNEVRTELACQHMRNPSRALVEISSLLGFSSPSAFSRWFKTQQGCNPTRWRKSNLN
jgi:AraC-like DNA-binding protein